MGSLDLIRHGAQGTIRGVSSMRTAVLASLWLAACGSKSAPEGVTALSIADPRGHWAAQGFHLLLTGVHLPSSDHQLDQVEIWAKLPEGATIEAAGQAPGAPAALTFPPGSILDRVEYSGRGAQRFVVDVRGTRIADDGEQHFHVYRRGERGLFGFQWARSDTAAHARATAALQDRLAKLPEIARLDDARRDAFLGSVAGKNACAECHALARPTNATQGEHGLVNRGTDASGFFTPWTVFENAVPLERYGGHDRSETDRYTTVRCPAGAEPTTGADGRARCEGGAVPIGEYDLPRALADGDPRALGICAARTYLGRHLSTDLRHRFATALRQCEDAAVTDPDGPG